MLIQNTMSIETVECSLLVPNSTINSDSSESCSLITDRRFFGDYYTVSYAVFLIQAQEICKISIDSWRFPMVSHPKMKENMELLKFNSNHGDIKVAISNLLKISSKIYKSDSKVKALVAVTDTDTDKVLHKIRKWNLNVESIERMVSGRHCLLAASKLDIKAKWPEYFIKSTNMKSNCCGNSVLQFDFCEDTSYTINIFGDHVFSYSFPVEGVKDSRIGFRYTLANSKDSSLENLVNIGYYWQNFRTPTTHNFRGVRIPCFSNILTSSGISQLKSAYAGAWEVFGLQSNGIFSVNKKGHSISLKTLVVAQKKGFNKPPKKNSKYLSFYDENDCGYPLKFNIYVECFYQHGDGSCQNKIPLVGTFINEKDLLL